MSCVEIFFFNICLKITSVSFSGVSADAPCLETKLNWRLRSGSCKLLHFSGHFSATNSRHNSRDFSAAFSCSFICTVHHQETCQIKRSPVINQSRNMYNARFIFTWNIYLLLLPTYTIHKIQNTKVTIFSGTKNYFFK